MIAYLPAGHPARPTLVGALQRLERALATTQELDGHWRTPLQDPGSPIEISTASFFAAGAGRAERLGLLSSEGRAAGERAWLAALDSVSPDGKMRGISAAVRASTAISHYRHVRTGFQVPWGQGPFLLAAAERLSVTARPEAAA